MVTRETIIARALRQSRGSVRMPLLKKGFIQFRALESKVSVPCTVWNLSDTGACIRVIAPPGMPKRFDLIIGHSRRACAVVWQKSNTSQSIQLGIAFQSATRL